MSLHPQADGGLLQPEAQPACRPAQGHTEVSLSAERLFSFGTINCVLLSTLLIITNMLQYSKIEYSVIKVGSYCVLIVTDYFVNSVFDVNAETEELM